MVISLIKFDHLSRYCENAAFKILALRIDRLYLLHDFNCRCSCDDALPSSGDDAHDGTQWNDDAPETYGHGAADDALSSCWTGSWIERRYNTLFLLADPLYALEPYMKVKQLEAKISVNTSMRTLLLLLHVGIPSNVFCFLFLLHIDGVSETGVGN
jgi:hypothetical protein